MLNYIWPIFLIISFVFGICFGNIQETNTAIFESTENAVNLCIKLLGTICLWNGIMKIAIQTNIVKVITKLLNPIFKKIFPDINKNEEVYRYTVVLGQSNYKGDSMSLFTLHVHPSDVDVVRGVESYDVGSTIELRGRLDFSVEQNTVTKEQAFGKPITRVYTNRQKNFYIESGSDPIVGEAPYE